MISIIAAIASGNRALGLNNRLIYHIPEDLKRFKKITSGHPIIMGRKTFESIGQPLPNRKNIVITRDEEFYAEGVEVVHSVEEALRLASPFDVTQGDPEHQPNGPLAQGNNEIFVIGGGQIYNEVIDKADKLYLTIIEGNPEADTFFPPYSEFKTVVFEESHESDGLKYKFIDLKR